MAGRPAILKPLKNQWTVHKQRRVREIYQDGRLHARFGHSRDDCPYRGSTPPMKGQQQYRPHTYATQQRMAWLAGWDDETALMRKAAEEDPRRPQPIDEDDV